MSSNYKSPFTDKVYTYNFIQENQKMIAKFINKLNSFKTSFKYCEEVHGWDSMVDCDIDDAINKLALVMATFVDWYEPEEEQEIFKLMASQEK